MKVLVTGSYNDNIEGYEKLLLPVFKQACKEVAKEILSAGHTLIVSTSEADTYEYADPNLLAGAEDLARKDISIEVYAPKSKDLAEYLSKVESESGGTITYFQERYKHLGSIVHPILFEKNWQMGQAVAVSRCDVVIVMGGSGGSATIATIADLMNKPVIGIPYFGGLGSQYFWDKNSKQLSDLNFARSAIVRGIWVASSSESYVALAEQMSKARNRKSSSTGYVVLFGFALSLCVIWRIIFGENLTGEHWINLLPLDCCAGLLGWCLTFGVHMQKLYEQFAVGRGITPMERALKEVFVVSLLSIAYGFLICEASKLYGISVEALNVAQSTELAKGSTVIAFAVGVASTEAYFRLRKKLREAANA